MFSAVNLLCLAVVTPPSLWATPPEPPGRIIIAQEQIVGQLGAQGGEIRIPVRVTVKPAVGAVELRAFLTKEADRPAAPPKEPFYREEVRFEGRDERAQSRELVVVVPVPGPGNYKLDLRLSGRLDETNAFSDRAVRIIAVTDGGRYRVMTERESVLERRRARRQRFDEQLRVEPERPDIRLLFDDAIQLTPEEERGVRPLDVPADRQLEVRPVGPSAHLQPYYIDRTATSWAPKDPITVRGRLVYLDFDGVWRPLVNVSVNLWDEDTGWDEHLGTTVSGWDGRWSFSVNNDDGWLANGRDIYYSFKLENTRIRIQDCDGIDSTYEWESGVHDDLDDGAVVDFGTQTGGSDAGSMRIWNHLNLGWNHAVTVGGQDPGFVDCCFPYDQTRWDRFWEELDVESIYEDGPDVVKHEYAHAIMYYAYDEDNPSPGGSHSFDDMTQHAGQSWSEGWATAFALSADPDGAFNWHDGDGGRNIENFSASNRVGERNEGRVAAALNDMLDSPNDNNGGDENRGRNGHDDSNNSSRISLATMLRDVMWGSWQNDVLDFWYDLTGELVTPQGSEGQGIMYYNWMSVVEPGSCVASRVVARDTDQADDLLTGLRGFRDHALKPFDGGRRLAEIYYRNSPEMALIFLRNEDLRKQALTVMRHFSQVGRTASRHREQGRLQLTQPLVSPALAATMERILRQLEESGSPELKRDLLEVRDAMKKVERITAEQLTHRVAEAKSKRRDTSQPSIQPSQHNPASREAAESKELQDLLRTVPAPEDVDQPKAP